VNYNMSGLTISWYISSPKVSFANKNRQLTFVNSRLIKSPIIYRAVANAYNRYIPHTSFPAYILNVDIDPTLVDVNVHPRKQEVRFALENDIYSGFYNSVNTLLEKTTLINLTPSSENESQNNAFSNIVNISYQTNSTPNYYTWSGTKFKTYSPYTDKTSNPAQTQISDAIKFSASLYSENEEENLDTFEKSLDLHDTKLWKIIGQAFNSYIIVETSQWLQILDQHALAERIIYEKLVNQESRDNSQILLIKESLNLTPKEVNVLQENEEVFKSMWFDFELLPNSMVIIWAIPDFINKNEIKNIVLGILQDLRDWSSKSKTLQEVKNKIFAYTACRSAIKFGNKLNLFEMNKLLNDSVEWYTSTCPHWRPVIFDISLNELKGKYER